MSNTVTNGIRIQVESEFLEDESDLEASEFIFSYHITISNEGSDVVQLMTRHWIITDANGERKDVKGPGVVGYQPVLQPGQSFDYSSFCPLSTPVGSMHGSFQMVVEDGEDFDAMIDPFTLEVPGTLQ